MTLHLWEESLHFSAHSKDFGCTLQQIKYVKSLQNHSLESSFPSKMPNMVEKKTKMSYLVTVLKALGNDLKQNWSSYASATFLKQNNTHCREGVLTYDRCTKHRDIRLGFSKHKVTDLFWVRIYGLQHGLNVKQSLCYSAMNKTQEHPQMARSETKYSGTFQFYWQKLCSDIETCMPLLRK